MIYLLHLSKLEGKGTFSRFKRWILIFTKMCSLIQFSCMLIAIWFKGISHLLFDLSCSSLTSFLLLRFFFCFFSFWWWLPLFRQLRTSSLGVNWVSLVNSWGAFKEGKWWLLFFDLFSSFRSLSLYILIAMALFLPCF